MEGAPKSDNKKEINDALMQIGLLEQIERQKGAFDSEGDAFNAIRESLVQKKITPEEAIGQARAIGESRYDYH